MTDRAAIRKAAMARRRHPDKEIEAALRFAEDNGRRISLGGSHAWGKIYCPYDDEECRCGEFCIASVWTTPRNASAHARHIRRVVEGCMRNLGDGVGDD
ncbi:hypothetical protein ACTZWW_14395 [Salinarimonas sp. NSM]|uniref:hypothetical protein n=1 Tax=Salinarimonas sp. NSM TaxID=3458003 RepID=UPI0040351538